MKRRNFGNAETLETQKLGNSETLERGDELETNKLESRNYFASISILNCRPKIAAARKR